MSYSVQNIRNVCLLGHSGSGKTALAESLLYMTGAIDRMGRGADGNTAIFESSFSNAGQGLSAGSGRLFRPHRSGFPARPGG